MKQKRVDFTSTSIKLTHDHNRSHVYNTPLLSETQNKQPTDHHALARKLKPGLDVIVNHAFALPRIRRTQRRQQSGAQSLLTRYPTTFAVSTQKLQSQLPWGGKEKPKKTEGTLVCTTNFFQP
jgi:hypothetical protein